MRAYQFNTIDQNGEVNVYKVECFNLKQAKNYRSEIIGNSQSGEKIHGHINRVLK